VLFTRWGGLGMPIEDGLPLEGLPAGVTGHIRTRTRRDGTTERMLWLSTRLPNGPHFTGAQELRPGESVESLALQFDLEAEGASRRR
jgi:hypothetical protein